MVERRRRQQRLRRGNGTGLRPAAEVASEQAGLDPTTGTDLRPAGEVAGEQAAGRLRRLQAERNAPLGPYEQALNVGEAQLESSVPATRGMVAGSAGNEAYAERQAEEATRIQREAAGEGPPIMQATDIESWSDVPQFIGQNVVSQIPNVATTIAGGLAGGGLAGLARRGVRYGLRRAARETGEDTIEAGARRATREAAQDTAEAARTGLSRTAKIGAGTGVAATGSAQIAGEMFPRLMNDEEAREDHSVTELSQRALAGSLAAGTAELAPAVTLAKRFGLTGAARKLQQNVAKRVAGSTAAQAASETGTEVFQQALMRGIHSTVNENIEAFDDEGLKELFNAGAAGLAVGGSTGAVAGLASGSGRRNRRKGSLGRARAKRKAEREGRAADEALARQAFENLRERAPEAAAEVAPEGGTPDFSSEDTQRRVHEATLRFSRNVDPRGEMQFDERMDAVANELIGQFTEEALALRSNADRLINEQPEGADTTTLRENADTRRRTAERMDAEMGRIEGVIDRLQRAREQGDAEAFINQTVDSIIDGDITLDDRTIEVLTRAFEPFRAQFSDIWRLRKAERGNAPTGAASLDMSDIDSDRQEEEGEAPNPFQVMSQDEFDAEAEVNLDARTPSALREQETGKVRFIGQSARNGRTEPWVSQDSMMKTVPPGKDVGLDPAQTRIRRMKEQYGRTDDDDTPDSVTTPEGYFERVPFRRVVEAEFLNEQRRREADPNRDLEVEADREELADLEDQLAQGQQAGTLSEREQNRLVERIDRTRRRIPRGPRPDDPRPVDAEGNPEIDTGSREPAPVRTRQAPESDQEALDAGRPDTRTDPDPGRVVSEETFTPSEVTTERHAFDDRLTNERIVARVRELVEQTGYDDRGGLIIRDPETGEVTDRTRWIARDEEVQSIVKGTPWATENGRGDLRALIERAIEAEKTQAPADTLPSTQAAVGERRREVRDRIQELNDTRLRLMGEIRELWQQIGEDTRADGEQYSQLQQRLDEANTELERLSEEQERFRNEEDQLRERGEALAAGQEVSTPRGQSEAPRFGARQERTVRAFIDLAEERVFEDSRQDPLNQSLREDDQQALDADEEAEIDAIARREDADEDAQAQAATREAAEAEELARTPNELERYLAERGREMQRDLEATNSPRARLFDPDDPAAILDEFVVIRHTETPPQFGQEDPTVLTPAELERATHRDREDLPRESSGRYKREKLRRDTRDDSLPRGTIAVTERTYFRHGETLDDQINRMEREARRNDISAEERADIRERINTVLEVQSNTEDTEPGSYVRDENGDRILLNEEEVIYNVQEAANAIRDRLPDREDVQAGSDAREIEVAWEAISSITNQAGKDVELSFEDLRPNTVLMTRAERTDDEGNVIRERREITWREMRRTGAARLRAQLENLKYRQRRGENVDDRIELIEDELSKARRDENRYKTQEDIAAREVLAEPLEYSEEDVQWARDHLQSRAEQHAEAMSRERGMREPGERDERTDDEASPMQIIASAQQELNRLREQRALINEQIEEMESSYEAPSEQLVSDIREAGIPNPESFARLLKKVRNTEKDQNERARDPDTGEDLDADDLIARGVDPESRDFSRRRGYTEEERSEFEELMRRYDEALEQGVDVDAAMSVEHGNQEELQNAPLRQPSEEDAAGIQTARQARDEVDEQIAAVEARIREQEQAAANVDAQPTDRAEQPVNVDQGVRRHQQGDSEAGTDEDRRPPRRRHAGDQTFTAVGRDRKRMLAAERAVRRLRSMKPFMTRKGAEVFEDVLGYKTARPDDLNEMIAEAGRARDRYQQQVWDYSVAERREFMEKALRYASVEDAREQFHQVFGERLPPRATREEIRERVEQASDLKRQVRAPVSQLQDEQNMVQTWARKLNVTSPDTLRVVGRDEIAGFVQGVDLADLMAGAINGVHVRDADGNTLIHVRDGLTREARVEVLAHELGHVVYAEQIRNATEGEAQQMWAAFNKWREARNKPRAEIRTAITTKQALNMAAENLAGMRNYARVRDMGTESRQDLFDFEEWFADNTARWLTLTKEPRTVIERFFKRVADSLKTLFEQARKPRKQGGQNLSYRAEKSVAGFLRRMWNKTPRDVQSSLEGRQASEQAHSEMAPRRGPEFSSARTGGYEVSSRGDSRFSAFNARLEDGRTIEEAYQLDVKGYRETGATDPAAGKGKPPLRDITQEQSWQEYLALWRQWADENPQLMDELAEAVRAKGGVLSDRFANTPINQARALAQILNDRSRDSGTQTSDAMAEQQEQTSEAMRDLEKQVSEEVVLEGGPDDDAFVRSIMGAAIDQNADPHSTSAGIGFDRAFELLTPEERATLGRFVMRPEIRRQLERLIDDKGTMHSIDNGNVPLAMREGYKFWMSKDLNTDPQAHSLFQKLYNKLAEIFGVITEHENAAEVITALRNGTVAARRQSGARLGDGVVKRFRRHNRLQETAAKAVQGFELAIKPLRWAYGAQSRIIAMDNPVYTAITQEFQPRPGTERNAQGMYEARNAMRGVFHSRVFSATENLSDTQGEDLLKMLQGDPDAQPLPEGNPVREAHDKIRRLLDDMRRYAVSRGVKMGFIEDYWPQVMDLETLETRHAEFINLLSQEKFNDELQTTFDPNAELRKLTAEERVHHAESIYDALMKHDGYADTDMEVQDGNNVPALGAAHQRKLAWVRELGDADDVRQFISFQKQDIGEILAAYTEQIIKRSEWTSRFGNDGSRLEKKLKEARRFGATEQDEALMKKYINAMMGTHGRELAPMLQQIATTTGKWFGQDWSNLNPDRFRKLQGIMMVYQNIRVLGLATLTSIADTGGIIVRSNDLGTAMQAFRQGLREITLGIQQHTVGRGRPRSEYQSEMRRLAETLGTIDMHMVNEVLGESYGGLYLTGKSRKYNEQFFRLIQLQRWTQFSRIMSLAAGKTFLLKHRDGAYSEHSERFLQQLNLKPEDIKTTESGDLLVLSEEQRRELSDQRAQARRELAELEENDPENVLEIGQLRMEIDDLRDELLRDSRIRTALNRYVDESVMRPNPAQRPIWASHPDAQLLFHLKQFAYAIHNQITRRILTEAGQGNYWPMLAATSYIPIMIAADLLREDIQYGEDGDPRKRHWDAWDYVKDGVHRSGMTGLGTFLLDAHKDRTQFGGVGYESLQGPTITQLRDIGDYLINGDGEGLNLLAESLPANSLWSNWDLDMTQIEEAPQELQRNAIGSWRN